MLILQISKIKFLENSSLISLPKLTKKQDTLKLNNYKCIYKMISYFDTSFKRRLFAL